MGKEPVNTKPSGKTSDEDLSPTAKLERNYNHYKKQAKTIIDNSKDSEMFFKWSGDDLVLRQERLKNVGSD